MIIIYVSVCVCVCACVRGACRRYNILHVCSKSVFYPSLGLGGDYFTKMPSLPKDGLPFKFP